MAGHGVAGCTWWGWGVAWGHGMGGVVGRGVAGHDRAWWGRVQWEARLSRVCLCGLGAPCTWPTLLTYHTYLVPVDP